MKPSRGPAHIVSEVRDALEAAHVALPIELSINCFLIETGSRTILIDGTRTRIPVPRPDGTGSGYLPGITEAPQTRIQRDGRSLPVTISW